MQQLAMNVSNALQTNPSPRTTEGGYNATKDNTAKAAPVEPRKSRALTITNPTTKQPVVLGTSFLLHCSAQVFLIAAPGTLHAKWHVVRVLGPFSLCTRAWPSDLNQSNLQL